MVKTLVKHGNSYALVIDKPILELLKLTPETRLEVSTTDGRTLTIAPATAATDPTIRAAVLEASLDDINLRFGEALKALAS